MMGCVNPVQVASVMNGDKAAALQQKLKDLGVASSEMPQIVYGADGVVAVSISRERGLLVCCLLCSPLVAGFSVAAVGIGCPQLSPF
jgi:hypothetical protein